VGIDNTASADPCAPFAASPLTPANPHPLPSPNACVASPFTPPHPFTPLSVVECRVRGVRTCGCLFVVLFLSCCCVCDLFLLSHPCLQVGIDNTVSSDPCARGLNLSPGHAYLFTLTHSYPSFTYFVHTSFIHTYSTHTCFFHRLASTTRPQLTHARVWVTSRRATLTFSWSLASTPPAWATSRLPRCRCITHPTGSAPPCVRSIRSRRPPLRCSRRRARSIRTTMSTEEQSTT